MTSTPPAPSAAASTTNWQDSVTQQYRSDELSKIAVELSKLEKNATMHSKLGLASKFEISIFTSAKSLNDYHKKIKKRLNKLKKNYESAKASSATTGASGVAGAVTDSSTGNGGDGQKELEEKIIIKKRQLRTMHGDTLRLIAENGRVAAMGVPKLSDHIIKFNTYALEIGAISSDLAINVSTGKKIILPQRSARDTWEELKILEKNLEDKITTLREWILKFSKEDVFFGEKLDSVEKNVLLNTDKDYYKIFFKGLQDAIQQENVTDLLNLSTEDIKKQLQHHQDKLKETIALPRNKEEEKSASLIYINRIRVASQFCLLYILLAPHEQGAKIEFAGSLKGANDSIFDSIKQLKDLLKEDDDVKKKSKKNNDDNDGIKLEDAWNKILEYDAPVMESADGITTMEPDAKKQKVEESLEQKSNVKIERPLALRTKVLLAGGRKIPSNLLDALKRKSAQLCQSEGRNFTSTHLKLQFGKSFEMLIYLSPLVIKIRALDKGTTTTMKREKLDTTKRYYDVMGVSGDIHTVGKLVTKQLEYASAHATRCLRRCFADIACRANSSDFETEILEGNALLKFLNIARNTYCSNLTDKELP